MTRSGGLKHLNPLPFFSREPRISGDISAATTLSRSPPTSRHVRKNSKAARLLGIADTPENSSSNDVTLPIYAGIMSPPLLPMDDDPFASRPLGTLVLGSGNPASQMHTITQLTSQYCSASLTATFRSGAHGTSHCSHVHSACLCIPTCTSPPCRE